MFQAMQVGLSLSLNLLDDAKSQASPRREATGSWGGEAHRPSRASLSGELEETN